MDKQKLLLIGYRAIGDWLFTVPALPYLFEKYDVYLECNMKGWSLLYDDPRFKRKALFIVEKTKPETRAKEFEARWHMLRKQIKPDVEINLNASLEVTCIAQDFQDEFHWPVGSRRVAFGTNGFYDAVFARCGLATPNPLDLRGLWFSEEQEDTVKAWRKRLGKQFVVMVPISGSTKQKMFVNYKEVVSGILDRYPDSFVYLMGADDLRKYHIDHPRVKGCYGISMKQAVHMTKYVDMVVGPETGLIVAAGMWGTPKTFLGTASSIWQMAQYQKNDFSIQSPLPCSPCHRAIYKREDCETPEGEGDNWIPSCAGSFSTEQILQRVDYVYRNLRRNWGE